MHQVEVNGKLKAPRLRVSILLAATVLLTTSCGGRFTRTPAPRNVERDATSIYGAFLNSWTKGGKYTANVYKAAQLRTQQDTKDYAECARKLGERNTRWGESYSFRDLRRVIGRIPYVHFVRSNDPRALDRGGPSAEATSESAAIAATFAHSVVTLSAITFNKPHTLAMFQFSSVCGGLCGYGHVVVFKRTPNGWVLQKESTSCGAWIS